MSTIKFVPMEFFAQFALTQMRRLQARGAVGAAFSGAGRGWWAQVAVCTAFPARGAYCERWALSARLSGSGNIVGGRGALFAGVGCCRRGFFEHGNIIGGRGELLGAQVAVCTAFPARGAYCERWALSARLSGSGNIVGGRGELLVGVGALLAGVGRCRRARGRCLRAWGAVGGRGSPFAQLFQARGSAAPSCARPRPSARRTVLAARPAL